MLTKWNNKTNTVKVNDILQFLFWYFARHVNNSSFFSMTIVWLCYILTYYYFSCFVIVIISPSFSLQEYICKIIYIFFIIIITVPDWVQMLTYQCLCLHCTRALIDKHWLYVVTYRKRVIHKTSWLPNSLLLYIH
jgi:hypothetical protein